MKRKDFLKNIGLAGAASVIPFKGVLADAASKTSTSCTLIPTETAGPFPLDLTTNTTFFRSDIRESKTGVQLNLKLKILGEDNCGVMDNVRVNIWHCDKDGSYSGYAKSAGNTTDTVGETWLRGYQITDVNGEVEFVTIFPGWYSGRICHIHFQVYVSSSYAAISQLSFDINAKNTLYSTYSSLYTKGADPMSFASDGIFSDGYSYQLASLTPNSSGGYDAYLEITVKGAGKLGVGYTEMQNATQFTLRQNFPNAFAERTTIPFSLNQKSDVAIEIWDLMGRKVAVILNEQLNAGEHSVAFVPKDWALMPANYVYQIQVANKNGVFRDTKLMTCLK